MADVARIYRPRRCLKNSLRVLTSKNYLPTDFAIAAYGYEGRIHAVLWNSLRQYILVGDNWRTIALCYLRQVERPSPFQGNMADATLDISDIIGRCAAKGTTGTVSGYKPFTVTTSTPKKFEKRMLQKSSDLANILGVDISGWEWADQKKGEQITNKLQRFHEVDNVPVTVDPVDLFLVCVDLLLSFPRKDGKSIKEPPLLVDDALDHLKVRDSSSGYDPPGHPGGHNKRENAIYALSQYQHMRLGGRLKAPLVYAVQSKGNEFLPKHKDQRKIFCESTVQNVGLQMTFGSLIYQPRNFFSGSAQQLSQGGNTGIQYAMKLTPDLNWGEPGSKCLERAKEILTAENSLSESDKSQWEYRVPVPLKACVFMVACHRIDWSKDILALQPAAAVIAAYLVPLVAMQGRHVVIAPNFMPSGSLFTLFGNSEAHRTIACFYKHHRLKTTPEDEEKVRIWWESSIFQGDDFISRNVPGVSAEYDVWADKTFGTKTNTVTGNCAETRFLQRKLTWMKTKGAPLPKLAYDVERAKIKMCAPRQDEATMAESIKSIVLSTGDPLLALQVKPFVEQLTRESKHLVNPSSGGGTTDTAAISPGVVQRAYLPTNTVRRDTIESLRLQHANGCHPDYYESLRRRN